MPTESRPEARPMVLRSINLPADLDEQLRAVAFVLRRPKSDLIRTFVADGLAHLMGALRSASETQMSDGLKSLYAHLDQSSQPYSSEEQRRFREDFERMQRFTQGQGARGGYAAAE